MKISRNISFALVGGLLGAAGVPQADAQNSDAAYAALVRKNASTFHRNFGAGDFDKNGPLVNEKIYVNSNGVIVIGRDRFVERLRRYHTPFPELALHDRVVLVDGNKAALLYVLQAEQKGPYGAIPPSGNKINVYSAEFFTMDDQGLMKELLTITEHDQLVRQIKGVDKVAAYEKIELAPTRESNAAVKQRLKGKLDAYVQNFNTRDWTAFGALFADGAAIKVNGRNLVGAAALIGELKTRIATLSDVTYHLDRNVVEGDRGAIAYTVNAIYKPAGKAGAGKPILSREGLHFQFDDGGKITQLVIVYNGDDLREQMRLM